MLNPRIHRLLTAILLLLGFLSLPAAEDESLETFSPDSFADTSQSNLKPQIDSAISILRKTGRMIKKEFNRLVEGERDSTPSPEAIEQEIRLKFTQLVGKNTPVPAIKAWQLLKCYQDSDMILVDVRESKEIDVSKIPGALSPPEFAQKYRNPALLTGKKVITYCTIGYRSDEYARQLKEFGIHVLNLEGGILAWTHVHGPIVRVNENGIEEKTLEVHTFSEDWNLVHPDYTAKWGID